MEHDNLPLVTVAILSYDQEDVLYNCIQSVCCQNYARIELLICDDGSKNFHETKVKQFIEKYKRENIVSYQVLHTMVNEGTVRNCNRAVLYAKGELLKLLAADDLLYDSRVISDLCAQFNDTYIQVVMGRGIAETGANGKTALFPTDMEFARICNATPQQMYDLLCSRPWSAIFAPAVMFRLSFLKWIGGFDTAYRYLEDWPLWIKLSKQDVCICAIPRVVVKYSLKGISSGSKRSERGYLVRKQYLQECRRVLTKEYLACKKNKKRILTLQVLLCAHCIIRRERILAHQNQKQDAPCWSLFSLLALPYQKIVGGIGNQRTFSTWGLIFLGVVLLSCIRYRHLIGSIMFALLFFGGVVWNGLLFLLRQKYKVRK